ncbi:MAG: E3 binding domain-containing protein [Hyphomicrobiaceae bacterium]|nr:E3 binding domain-containing protein [Hyphomicrobiaceae bacterium]
MRHADSDTGSAFVLRLPEIAGRGTRADLVAWLVLPGDTLFAGSEVAEIEAGGQVFSVRVGQPGVVVRLLVAEGALDLLVGTPIAVIRPLSAGAPDAANPVRSRGTAEPVLAPAERLTPRARRMADDLGVDIDGIVGSGPGGRVLARDIVSAGASRVSRHLGLGTTIPASELAFPVRLEWSRLVALSAGDLAQAAAGGTLVQSVIAVWRDALLAHPELMGIVPLGGNGRAEHAAGAALALLTGGPGGPAVTMYPAGEAGDASVAPRSLVYVAERPTNAACRLDLYDGMASALAVTPIIAGTDTHERLHVSLVIDARMVVPEAAEAALAAFVMQLERHLSRRA